MNSEEVFKTENCEERDTERFTDTSNAEKINQVFGNKIRYDHRRKRWLVWKDHRWQPDVDGAINRMAIDASRVRYQAATEISDLNQRTIASKWAIQSESRLRLDAATSIAKNLLPIADSGENWDSDPMLLSCLNGIVDLRTGKIRKGLPGDRITMVTGGKYDPDADCPLWKKFISEVFEDNQDLINYVKKALGYSLTGEMKEQAVFFCFGVGSNGKSVLFSTIREILGDYAYNAPATLFQRNTMATSSNDVASTEFKRFIMSAEILSSTKINELRLKKWSGGDQETARYLYSEYFSFYPACKIWLFVNHKPQVEDDSFGFWRRVRLIPFNRVFSESEQDKDLTKKLKNELSGILNWLIEGCLLWQAEGLQPLPAIIEGATKSYQAENDVLAEFLFDCIEETENDSQAMAVFKKYKEWAEMQGLQGKDTLTNTSFGRRMSDKFPKRMVDGRVFYRGISIKGGFSRGFAVPEVIVDPHFHKSPLIKTRINSLVKTTSNPLPRHENPLPTKSAQIPPGLQGIL
ncbi:hypothetical protein HYW46_03070 [Candidatus Daviesbacteria bacterium]|nr:hypothetical protein [Candidatus Daviesbacteria bacterium]